MATYKSSEFIYSPTDDGFYTATPVWDKSGRYVCLEDSLEECLEITGDSMSDLTEE